LRILKFVTAVALQVITPTTFVGGPGGFVDRPDLTLSETLVDETSAKVGSFRLSTKLLSLPFLIQGFTSLSTRELHGM